MKSVKIDCFMNKIFFVVLIAGIMMSCDNREENRRENEPRAVATISDEVMKDQFQRLVSLTNMTYDSIFVEMGKVSLKISELQDDQEAFKLYDCLLELAISQNVAEVENYQIKYNWFAKLWHVAMGSFLGAQRKNNNDFEYWDKLFRFYAKYTAEIAKEEKTLPSKELDPDCVRDSEKRSYLHGLKGELKTWVNVMKIGYFPRMSKGYTEEQKFDILRKFEEVEKYTKSRVIR